MLHRRHRSELPKIQSLPNAADQKKHSQYNQKDRSLYCNQKDHSTSTSVASTEYCGTHQYATNGPADAQGELYPTATPGLSIGPATRRSNSRDAGSRQAFLAEVPI